MGSVASSSSQVLARSEEQKEAVVLGKTKRHGPRYKLKRTPRHFVTRDAKGQFKKFTRIGRSLRQDRVWKAPKERRSGFGHRKDKW
jgi:hypothetical protein